MIDTHCHLNDKSYDKDIAEVIQNGIDAGIEYFIVPATCPEDLHKTVDIANAFDRVYCAVGVHPHDASKVTNTTLSDIKTLSKEKKVVAIGEIGLDYHYNNSIPDKQMTVLRKQIEIALELSKPIILHNRESDTDVLNILNDYKNSNLTGVCHCFSSSLDMLNKLLELGFYISYTANITFSKINMDNVILQTPAESLMLETDSPYMTPPPNRGKRNLPQNVLLVAKKISEIKNIPLKEIITMTTDNAKKLFQLPLLTAILILITTLFCSNNVYSQIDNEDEYWEETEGDYEDKIPDPYIRKIGIGVLFGTNTIVDRYTAGQKSFSWEGLFSIGANITYKFANNFIAQLAYTYSKNNKAVERLPDTLKHIIDANYHRAVELNIIGMVNPESIVNFYASLGATYFMNEWSRNFSGIGGEGKHYLYDDKVGLNLGIGAFVNINAGSIGTFTLNAEWKLGFRLDEMVFNYDPRVSNNNSEYYKTTSHSSMCSIPRAGIIWYVPFIK